MRVVETSEFVMPPLGGMTLAQLGQTSFRIDAVGGGLDYRRWPASRITTSACSGPVNKIQALRCPQFPVTWFGAGPPDHYRTRS